MLRHTANQQHITFNTLIKGLMEIGVREISANLISGVNTLRMEDETCHVATGCPVEVFIPAFRLTQVFQLFQSLQNGELCYSDFCKLLAQAGCVECTIRISAGHLRFRGNGNEYTAIWHLGL